MRIIQKKYNDINININLFDSMTESDRFTNKVFSDFKVDLNKKNFSDFDNTFYTKIKNKKQWFGSDISLEGLENYNIFNYNKELLELKNKVSDSLSKLRNKVVLSKVKKKKLAFTRQEIGVFSFDRAAIGLQKIKNQEGEIKVITKEPKLFAYFPEKPKQVKNIKIINFVGGSASKNPLELIYSGISTILIIEYLLKLNYKVELISIFGSYNEFTKNICLTAVKTKAYAERMDYNKISILTSDPHYFRYKGFKSIVAATDSFNLPLSTSLGYPTPSDQYRNIANMISNKDEKVLTLGNCYSENEAINQINETINNILANDF